MINPDLDGVDHINVYSKGKTELGRFLSNFANTPFIHPRDGAFDSIEGYWYWLSCKDNRLRFVSGFWAKKLGRECGGKDWIDDKEFKQDILSAIFIKLESNPEKFKELEECNLPLKHYYVYGTKVIEPKEGKWIIDYLNGHRLMNE